MYLAAREVTLRVVKLFRSEVSADVSGALNFTLCEAQYFTAASPLLHLAKPNVTELHIGKYRIIAMRLNTVKGEFLKENKFPDLSRHSGGTAVHLL